MSIVGRLRRVGETKSEDTAEEVDSAVPFHDVDGDGFWWKMEIVTTQTPDISFWPNCKLRSDGCGWVVSSGIDYACGLAWGRDLVLGDDNGEDNLKAPEGTFVDISVGTGHGCARDANNMVPVGVGIPMVKACTDILMKSISAGAYQTCGIDMNDKVVCWGGYNARNGTGRTFPLKSITLPS